MARISQLCVFVSAVEWFKASSVWLASLELKIQWEITPWNLWIELESANYPYFSHWKLRGFQLPYN